MIETKIEKTAKGHKVSFTIGVQTFYLKEQEPEEEISSYKYAKWYQKQLNTAFRLLRDEMASKTIKILESHSTNIDEQKYGGNSKAVLENEYQAIADEIRNF